MCIGYAAGHKLSMPIVVAPMSQQRMADDEGELAVARAVAKEDTVMVSVPCTLCSMHENILLIRLLKGEWPLRPCRLCVTGALQRNDFPHCSLTGDSLSW